MNEIRIITTVMWTMLLAVARQQGSKARSERGAVSTEWVIIAGGIAVVAIAAVAVIASKVNSKVSSIPTD